MDLLILNIKINYSLMQDMDYLRIRATLLTIKETQNNGLIFYITPILNFQKGDGAHDNNKEQW